MCFGCFLVVLFVRQGEGLGLGLGSMALSGRNLVALSLRHCLLMTLNRGWQRGALFSGRFLQVQ